MKANKIQQYLCSIIHCKQWSWQHSNDITSPTHFSDIENDCREQLCDLISNEDIEELKEKLKGLYSFIRKFDNYESTR